MNIWRFLQLTLKNSNPNRKRARNGEPIKLTLSELELYKKLFNPEEKKD